jgi:O-acetyl-ADP-ribose deacetylase (regulator of RNase III)
VQDELRALLKRSGRRAVEAGTVIQTGPGPLAVKWILHAVAIDPFYDSSIDLVARTIATALDRATELGAMTIAMPMLATGFGRLSTEDFGAALVTIRDRDWPAVERLAVVVRNAEDCQILSRLLSSR